MTDSQLDLYINGKLIIIARSMCSIEPQLGYSLRRWLSIFDFEGKKVHVMWQFHDEVITMVLSGARLYETTREPVLIAA